MKLFPLQKSISLTLALLLSFQGLVWSTPSHPTSEKSSITEHNNLAPQSFVANLFRGASARTEAREKAQAEARAKSTEIGNATIALNAVGTKTNIDMSTIDHFQLNEKESEKVVASLKRVINEENLNKMKNEGRNFGILVTAEREARYDKSLDDTLKMLESITTKDEENKTKIFIADFNSHHQPYSYFKDGNLYLSAAYFGFKESEKGIIKNLLGKASKALFKEDYINKTFEKFKKAQQEDKAKIHIGKSPLQWLFQLLNPFSLLQPTKILADIITPKITPAIAQNIFYHELIKNGFDNKEAYHMKGVMTYSPSKYKLGKLSENEKFWINYHVQNHHDRKWLKEKIKNTKSINEQFTHQSFFDLDLLTSEIDILTVQQQIDGKKILAQAVIDNANAYTKSIRVRGAYHNVVLIALSIAIGLYFGHDITEFLHKIIHLAGEIFHYNHIKDIGFESKHLAGFLLVMFPMGTPGWVTKYITPKVNWMLNSRIANKLVKPAIAKISPIIKTIKEFYEILSGAHEADAEKVAKDAAKKAEKLAEKADKLEKKLMEKLAKQEAKDKKSAEEIARMKAEAAINEEKAAQLKDEILFQKNLQKQLSEIYSAIEDFQDQVAIKAKISESKISRSERNQIKKAANFEENLKNTQKNIISLGDTINSHYPGFSDLLLKLLKSIEKTPLDQTKISQAYAGFDFDINFLLQIPVYDINFQSNLGPYSEISAAA